MGILESTRTTSQQGPETDILLKRNFFGALLAAALQDTAKCAPVCFRNVSLHV